MENKDILNNEEVKQRVYTISDEEKQKKLESVLMTDEQLRKAEKKQKVFKIFRVILTYLFLFVLAVIMVFPFYWMINSSLKSLDEYYQATPTFFPNKIHFENYKNAWESADFGR